MSQHIEAQTLQYIESVNDWKQFLDFFLFLHSM